jgi:hypothetical protein
MIVWDWIDAYHLESLFGVGMCGREEMDLKGEALSLEMERLLIDGDVVDVFNPWSSQKKR